ncbi:hypothetical protein KP509_18G015200 [Ceratopteris richardii]|uniref:Uncharacterized protein n=1 Tax=Ceratopteris richardii TaxID=49495 RepID=A0A8T2SNJ2_CERRI|nr:hypothetical protein KP509_18G015200 [Ceratopteris richardii]
MRPRKKLKAAFARDNELREEYMVQSKICQTAIDELKQLMEKSKRQKEISPSSSSGIEIPFSTSTNVNNDIHIPLSRSHTGFSSGKSGLNSREPDNVEQHPRAERIAPNDILRRLSVIEEEVNEFLRSSESLLKQRKRRTHRSSQLHKLNEAEDYSCQDTISHTKGKMDRSYGLKLSPKNDDRGLCDNPTGLETFCNDLKHDSTEDAKLNESTVCNKVHDEHVTNHSWKEYDEKEESDAEDDGLKEIWCEAEFYWKCQIQGQREQKIKESLDKEACRHTFFFKADMGLVCDACGLVGIDVEAIFNFTWGHEFRHKEVKAKENGAAGIHVLIDGYQEHSANSKNVTDSTEQKNQRLILHPLHKAEMHEHQVEGFKFLEDNIVNGHHGCILAHAPGTGKTFLAIAFLHSFLQANTESRVMILAPKVMLLPWVKEFQKWKFDFPLLNLYENSCLSPLTMALNSNKFMEIDNTFNKDLKRNYLQKIKEWQMTKSILLVSYQHMASLVNHQTGDTLTMEVKKLLLEVPSLLILDEGHISRNSDTVILKCLTDVCTKKRIMLSGTLFQNNFEEMFNLFKLVRPDFMQEKAEILKGFFKNLLDGEAGDDIRSKIFEIKLTKTKHREEVTEQKLFVNCLCHKIESGSAEEQAEALKLLHELMSPFVHWHRGKALEGIPGLTDLTVFLQLTPSQKELFTQLRSQNLNAMERERRSALANVHPVLLTIRRPKQVPHGKECLGSVDGNIEPITDDVDGNALNALTECDPTQGCKAKFVLNMVVLCTQLQEKVLIFSQNLSSLTLLQRLFRKLWRWTDEHELLRLDGDTGSAQREYIINKFNRSKKAQVLLASIKACGEGVSLVGASRVVFLDLSWNPAVMQQAISRAFRLGQNKRVYAYRLVGTGTLDEDIERASCKKERLARMICNASCDSDCGSGLEVDPEMEDRLFESAELKRQVVRCYRKAHGSIASS